MKRKFTLLLSMLLMLGAGSIWADDMTISSEAEWKTFVSTVKTAPSTNAKLTADITLTANAGNFANDYMPGTSSSPYSGTFDGQGYTITYTKTGLSENIQGLFRYINGATIKNLKVAGTLESSGQQIGGIVGQAHGNVTITNCESSVTLTRTGSSTDDATFGGIVGVVGDNSTSWTVNIKNCIYTGNITVNKSGSGLVGYIRNNVTMNISYCLFAGTITYTTQTNIANFSRGGSPTLTSCYYVNNYNSTGTAVTSALKDSGELAYTLNTGNTESVFIGQGNLNKANVEAMPSLTSDATKKVLKVKISGMSTAPYVNPGGAVPNPCRFGKLGFKLSDNDNQTLQEMPAESSFTYGTESGCSELKTTTGMYCIKLSAAASTLVLPFDCESLPAGITAYDITYASGDAVTATPVSKITANKPVLINGTAGNTYKFTGSFGGIFSGTDATNGKTNDNGALTGIYVNANASSGYNPIAYVPANSYVLQNKSGVLGFYQVENANTVRITSFRAYLTAQGGSSAPARLNITFDDNNTTGIKNVSEQTNNDDAIYTLNGTRVDHPVKGLYIKNGKKFIVK